MSEKVKEMFGSIASRYDVTNTVLSFGIHHLWRKKAVKLCNVQKGQHILDCATGTGDFAIEFKKAVGPGGRVVGTDFSPEMISPAPQKAAQKDLDITFEVADAMNLPYTDNEFDVASIAFGIRNVDDPFICLKELARVVKPGGKVVVLEFGQPAGLMKYPFTFYSKYVMPTVGGIMTGNRDAYEYLPETSARFPAGDKFIEIMDSTKSFTGAKAYPLQSGVAYIYIGNVK